MYDKDFDRSYEEWKFLEKFKSWNIELDREIVKVAEEQGINLRKVFGKAISNILRNGRETREILLYATDCFSVGKVSGNKNLQFLGVEEPVSCWHKAYIVELGEDFWQIRLAFLVGEHGESIVHYSKAVLDINDVEFDAENGKAISWTMPKNEQLIPIEWLRDI